MTEEDSGLLGDLPRTRPGRRSAKRATPATPARGPSSRTRAPRAAPAAAEETKPAEAELVIGAARAVAGVARVGLQTASRVASGVFGRIPRP